MSEEISKNRLWTGLIVACSLFAAGCQSKGTASAQGPAPPPPAVSVITVKAEDTPLFTDYAAQTYARDMVEVRGRVDGYVEKRLFQIGSDVKAGQPLYILDLRPYQADVQKAKGDLAESEANSELAKRQVLLIQAQADLAQAQANLFKAKQDVDRVKPLVEQDAAAKQELDNALAALQANEAIVNSRKANVDQIRLSTKAQVDVAAAQVESKKAVLRSNELNLEYATITAPISGRIGDSLVQVGGLVTRGSNQPLTTIVPLNPIWVRFKVSESEYLNFQRRTDRAAATKLPLQLILADGRAHPHQGRIENTVNQVDQKTGTLELQATFPNPQQNILPGQFGRIRMEIEDLKGVTLVPQRAVMEMQGLQSVLTVGPDNKVLARSVVTGERVGDRWIIKQGLKPGDRVIVEGLQKARPGAPVTPQPYTPPPSPANAKQGD
jgi:membrane fusion protein (multidrug efflux system)